MKGRTIVVVGSVAVVVATALGFFWASRNGSQTLRLSGIVEIQEVRLGSKIGGRVLEVYVSEGKVVERGEKLVEFEVPELLAQEAQLVAKLAAAEAEHYRAKNGPRPEEVQAAQFAKEAAKARYDRMLAGWREEEKKQAQSELDSAYAALKRALEEYERVADAYRRNATARSDYESAVSTRDQAQGRHDAAKWRVEMMKRNRQEDIDMAKAEWLQAKAQWKLLDLGTREEDKVVAKARLDEIAAKLAELRVNLKEKIVYAPEKAVVELLAVRKGDLVLPNQPVVRVLRAEDMWVKVYVPETELGKIRLKQEVDVRIDSYPDTNFKGVIEQIATISEFTPRNVQTVEERRHQVFGVKVRVPDAKGFFRAGIAAEVIVPLQPAP